MWRASGFWPTWFVVVAAVGRVSGWRVEGFWLRRFVVMGRVCAALRRVSGLCCCVEGFWLKWFVVIGKTLCFSKKVCGGLLADMVCRHGQGFCCCVEVCWLLCGGLPADAWRASG